jgi:hypothetical protein
MGLSTPQPFTAPPVVFHTKSSATTTAIDLLCHSSPRSFKPPYSAVIPYRLAVSNSSTTSTYRRGEDSAARIAAPKSFHVAMTALEGREKVVAAATMTGRTWRDSSTIIDPLDAENEGKGRTELSGPCRQHF